MRRFVITSTKFTGSAELFYNADAVLCKIDCTDTSMNADTIRMFKKAVPSTIDELAAGGNFTAGTVVTEAGYRIPFEQFWKDYDKKINKARCIPLYDKLNDAETIACHTGIKGYNKYLAAVVVRQKLDPENWIKQKAWENEYK